MLASLRRLLVPPVFEEDDEKTRAAALLNAMLLFIAGCGVILPLVSAFVAPSDFGFTAALGAVLVMGSVGLAFLLRSGRVQLASALFCLLFMVVVTTGVFTFGGIRSAVAKSYLLVILMAGLLIGWRGAVAFGLFSVLSATAAFWAERQGTIRMPHDVVGTGDFVILIFIFVMMAMLLSFALRSIRVGFQGAREAAIELSSRNQELLAIRESLERRTAVLQTASEVSGGIASMLDPEQLMREVVELLRDRFVMYYVGLFLVEEIAAERDRERTESYAVLRAGTGWVGREMVEQGHRLLVGGDSMIGQCVASGESRLEQDVHMAILRYRNPLLPDTRSEAALPLITRGRVIGALSIQSERLRAFDEEEMAIMQALADQIASAIDNARLYVAAQEAAERSERVVQRYVQESWDTLVEDAPAASGYRYASGQSRADSEAWLLPMADAVRRGDIHVSQDEKAGAALAVPLIQNGVVIGVIGLQRPPGQEWSQDEQALMQSVSEQMTQALENRRLFQVARDRARRELVLRQTTERIRSQADFDAALRSAAQEMRKVVGATRVAIRLGTPGRLAETVSGLETSKEDRHGA